MIDESVEATYWDASAIVAQGDAVHAQLRRSSVNLTLSHLTDVELIRATAKRYASDERRRVRFERILLAFNRKLRKVALPADIDGLLRVARDLARNHRLNSNDSLHLAACLLAKRDVDGPITLASFDRDLRAAAAAEGLDLFPSRLNGA